MLEHRKIAPYVYVIRSCCLERLAAAMLCTTQGRSGHLSALFEKILVIAPFPDTAQAPTREHRSAEGSTKGNPTEEKMRSIWSSILPNSPSPIPLDESFFDLGGHSILATRLIFEVRKVFVVNAPLGLVFEEPTVKGLSSAIDRLRNADLGLSYQSDAAPTKPTHLSVPGTANVKDAALTYGEDYEKLVVTLASSYSPPPSDFNSRPLTVFLTGSTGFLGAFILADLMTRTTRVAKVVCLVRSADHASGLARLKELSTDRGVWDDAWVTSGRLEVVIGDLGLHQFGLGDQWGKIASEADVIVHNGALVSSGRSKPKYALIYF